MYLCAKHFTDQVISLGLKWVLHLRDQTTVMATFLLLGECRSQTTERVENTGPHAGNSSTEVSLSSLLEAVHQFTDVDMLSPGIPLEIFANIQLSVTQPLWVSHTIGNSKSTHSSEITQEVPGLTLCFSGSLSKETHFKGLGIFR